MRINKRNLSDLFYNLGPVIFIKFSKDLGIQICSYLLIGESPGQLNHLYKTKYYSFRNQYRKMKLMSKESMVT